MEGHIQGAQPKAPDAKALVGALKPLSRERLEVFFEVQGEVRQDRVLDMLRGFGPERNILKLLLPLRAITSSQSIPVTPTSVFVSRIKLGVTTKSCELLIDGSSSGPETLLSTNAVAD